MTSRFDICVMHTLAQECPFPNDWSNPRNFSNDAHDPGGKTMCGIIQREYDQWRKHHGLPTRDVRQMTSPEGFTIYHDMYWSPDCDRLPLGLDMAFFDSAVNEGVTEAVRILQHALSLVNDGNWGPRTTAAVGSIRDVPAVIKAFTARREEVYRESKGFQFFGKDWERRSAEIGAAALTMVA